MENLNPETNLLDHSNLWKWISAIALIVSIIALVSVYTQISKANADYICTHIVEENDPCGNGSWSDWETVSTSGDREQCTQSLKERRVYTGTREIRHILQYLTLRTGCDASYSQAGYGSGGGSSGFHGGSIISETSSCQIEEVKVTNDIPGVCNVGNKGNGNGGGNSGNDGVTTTTTSTQRDIKIDTETKGVSAKEQLDSFRREKIAANITADPDFLRSGTPTTVTWQGVEVTSCTVTGSNGDSWTGTAGQELSSPITSKMTFDLDCIAFDGSSVQDSVEVIVLPEFNEI